MTIFYICIFFLGAALASFINATLYRIDKEFKLKELLTQSSHCETCKHPLSWIDLFPVLGFLLNSGKCKYCGSKINPYYPISELILGSSFLLFLLFSVPFYLYVILIFLFILSYYDIKELGIPKDLTHIFLVVCVIIFLLTFDITHLYVPLVLAIFFVILNLFKKSFGVGDILIIIGLGILMTQHQSLIFFWLAIILALIYSIGIILKKKTSIKTTKVPMVPFLSIAFIISITYGESIWTYILKFFEI